MNTTSTTYQVAKDSLWITGTDSGLAIVKYVQTTPLPVRSEYAEQFRRDIKAYVAGELSADDFARLQAEGHIEHHADKEAAHLHFYASFLGLDYEHGRISKESFKKALLRLAEPPHLEWMPPQTVWEPGECTDQK